MDDQGAFFRVQIFATEELSSSMASKYAVLWQRLRMARPVLVAPATLRSIRLGMGFLYRGLDEGGIAVDPYAVSEQEHDASCEKEVALACKACASLPEGTEPTVARIARGGAATVASASSAVAQSSPASAASVSSDGPEELESRQAAMSGAGGEVAGGEGEGEGGLESESESDSTSDYEGPIVASQNTPATAGVPWEFDTVFEDPLHAEMALSVHGPRALKCIRKAWRDELMHTRSIMRFPRNPERFIGDVTLLTKKSNVTKLEASIAKGPISLKRCDSIMRKEGLISPSFEPASLEAGANHAYAPGSSLPT